MPKTYKSGRYVKLLGNECANPQCQSRIKVEGHHIIPKKYGGPDEYWDIIALCFPCHQRGKLHTNPDEFTIVLNSWKTSHEMRVLGFFLDEQEDDFDSKMQRAGYMAALRGRQSLTVKEFDLGTGVSGKDKQ